MNDNVLQTDRHLYEIQVKYMFFQSFCKYNKYTPHNRKFTVKTKETPIIVSIHQSKPHYLLDITSNHHQ